MTVIELYRKCNILTQLHRRYNISPVKYNGNFNFSFEVLIRDLHAFVDSTHLWILRVELYKETNMLSVNKIEVLMEIPRATSRPRPFSLKGLVFQVSLPCDINL